MDQRMDGRKVTMADCRVTNGANGRCPATTRVRTRYSTMTTTSRLAQRFDGERARVLRHAPVAGRSCERATDDGVTYRGVAIGIGHRSSCTLSLRGV